MTRICKICGSSSDHVEFYTGVNSRCKECHKEQVRLNRREKLEQYAAYEKMRFKRDAHRREAAKAYAKTPAGKASHAASVKKRISLHPDKRAANVILGNAVRDGRVIKPSNCSICQKTPARRNLHGHHDDYAKPLEVVWLCSSCHAVNHWGHAPEPADHARPRGRHVKRKP